MGRYTIVYNQIRKVHRLQDFAANILNFLDWSRDDRSLQNRLHEENPRLMIQEPTMAIWQV